MELYIMKTVLLSKSLSVIYEYFPHISNTAGDIFNHREISSIEKTLFLIGWGVGGIIYPPFF